MSSGSHSHSNSARRRILGCVFTTATTLSMRVTDAQALSKPSGAARIHASLSAEYESLSAFARDARAASLAEIACRREVGVEVCYV